MAGQVQVDTALMQATAQQSANKADNMITHAKTLTTGIDFVIQRWQGQAAEAFRLAMSAQKPVLEQLIQRLQFVAEKIRQGSEGFDTQDAGAQSKVAAQGQNFLTTPLNH